MSNLLQRIFRFYYDGFRSMTVGRTLWIMIVIKLTIMFLDSQNVQLRRAAADTHRYIA